MTYPEVPISDLDAAHEAFTMLTFEPLKGRGSEEIKPVSALLISACPYILSVKLKTAIDGRVLDKTVVLHDPSDLYKLVDALDPTLSLHSIDLVILHPEPGAPPAVHRLAAALSKADARSADKRHLLISEAGLGFEYPDEPMAPFAWGGWRLELLVRGLVGCTPSAFSKRPDQGAAAQEVSSGQPG